MTAIQDKITPLQDATEKATEDAYKTWKTLTVLNPNYMDPLYHSHAGHMLMVGGVTMMAFGSLLLKKIVSFKG